MMKLALNKLQKCIINCIKAYTAGIKDRPCSVTPLFAAAIAGMLIFASGALYRTDSVLFSSSRHLKLLASYDIYSRAGAAIENALNTYLKLADAYSESNTSAEAGKTKAGSGSGDLKISSDIIKQNTDNLVCGMIRYFKGDTDFLPDIYLPPAASSSPEATTGESPEATAGSSPKASAFSTIAGIDKVSLSAIIMYTDRQDINDIFIFIRLLHHAVQNVQGILLLLASGFILLAAAASGSRKQLAAAAAAGAGTAGLLSFSLLAVLYFWLRARMPSGIGLLEMSLPLSDEIIIGYVTDLMKPVILFLLLTGLLLPMSVIIYKRFLQDWGYRRKANEKAVCTRTRCASGIIAAVLFVSAIVSISGFTGSLQENGFAAAYEKAAGVSTKMKVIPATNDNIYTLEIKLVNKSNGNPVPGAFIEVEGKTDGDGIFINHSKSSDNEGSARFSIQAGSFRIGFIPESFPEGFKLPSPLFVNISQAGTTTITVSLEALSSGALPQK